LRMRENLAKGYDLRAKATAAMKYHEQLQKPEHVLVDNNGIDQYRVRN